MRGSFDFLKGSRIKLERVTKTEITCVAVSMSFLFLTENFLTYKKILYPRQPIIYIYPQTNFGAKISMRCNLEYPKLAFYTLTLHRFIRK